MISIEVLENTFVEVSVNTTKRILIIFIDL